MKTSAQRILARPVAEWPQAINATRESLEDVEQELSALIQRATLLEAYVSRRYNTGCGDQGHKASAKHARSVLVKVRKALGFAYPKGSPLGNAL